ncbi:PREDICTED: basic leucine zipper 23-like [Nelumbo nucifera]|uniref:BZIP domain-containing protein n=2 Tax=Nelumbo nucifera TaxID=4432 RepID=A0A822YAZ0_NELNU|nr:PREDICTED: basic leucine zipper 23-like [Nelumbo nucifera]DAD29597.1 TPA_asm: hypothetical protein HUJ06_031065 [Nelumbo nucifera]
MIRNDDPLKKRVIMDDGGVDTSDQVFPSNPDVSTDIQGSTSLDVLLDEILKSTRTCTHTHTCNLPGPDAAHTHTCYHTHTQVFASEEDDTPNHKQQSVTKSKRSSGNREAVRKYRAKKKAHTAYLEEEVKKLRLLNQQLIRRLQGQAMLEAEVLRLRSLLIDLRGKIDNELDNLSSQKHYNRSTSFKEGNGGIQSVDGRIGLECKTNAPCLHPDMGLSVQAGIGVNKQVVVNWEGSCQPPIVDCRVSTNRDVGQNLASGETHPDCSMPGTLDALGTLVSSTSQAE